MAGYPNLTDTRRLIVELDLAGADIVEVGMPFSDPLADGSTIQAAAQIALQSGMTISLLFDQLEGIREETQVPLVLMGYLNPVLQFGAEKFCRRCRETGVDGVILPDLPPEEFVEHFKKHFDEANLCPVFLVTPRSSEERIRQLDALSQGFLYAVSSATTTGKSGGFGEAQVAYFQRLASMNLKNPVLVGFGISDKNTFEMAGEQLAGAVVGSAFLRALEGGGTTAEFVRELRGN